MVVMLQLEGIHGIETPGVEYAAYLDSTRGKLPGPDIVVSRRTLLIIIKLSMIITRV